MIKKTEGGLYFSTLDPKTFKTFSEAATHEEYAKITREASRPDSRDDIQRMTDEAFKVPMANAPDRLAILEASLKGRAADPAMKPGLPIGEVLLHNVKAMRREQQASEDAALEAADWNQRHAAAKAEVSRLLEAAAEDVTIDRSEVVAFENLNRCLSTPGACEAHISSELRRLLGVEASRIAAKKQAAADELAAAQSKVAALEVSQRATSSVKVPVEGANLLERGHSLIANLMAAGAPFEAVDAALEAQNEAICGSTDKLVAVLAANGGDQC